MNGVETTILCVDDKKENLVALSAILDELGPKLLFATSGKEALKCLINHPVSLVLLDVQMPIIDGFETARLIKSNPMTSKIPIIFITAINKDISHVLKGFDVGGVDYISKPIDPSILRSKISVFLTLEKQKKKLEEEIALRMRSENRIKRYLDELRISNNEKLYVITHNPMTQLPNSLLLDSDLMKFSENQIGEGQPGLMYIDIDGFGLYNDCYGRQFSDQLLREVSERLTKLLQPDATLYHYSIDEFVIVHPNLSSEAQLLSDAEHINRNIRYPYWMSGTPIYLTVSIGVSYLPNCNGNPNDLIRSAQIALLEAKQKGKNRVLSSSAEPAQYQQQDLAIFKDIRTGIINNEFECFFQPKISVKLHKVIGAEALLRWKHPKQGYISPGQFVPFSEKNGIISKLTNLVLLDVQNKMHQIRSAVKGDLTLSVNISPLEISDPEILEKLYYFCNVGKQQDLGVEIEITEGAFLQNLNATIALINNMHDNNCKVSIDDFGSGYSCLGYLINLPIDYLKVDRSFVMNIEHDRKAFVIVKTIASLANELNLQLVSEGVENVNQLSLLEKLGCDIHQGFYFAKPMPLNEFIDFVNQYK